MVHEDVTICSYHVRKLFPWRNLLFVNKRQTFNVRINDRKVVITFVATVLLGKFSEAVLTALVLSELGIIAYKDLTFRDAKYELSGTFSILLVFRKNSLGSCI